MERYIVMRILVGMFLLFVVIFMIIQLASIGSNITGSEPTPDEPVTTQAFVLGEQNNGSSSVQYIVKGPVVAPEDRVELRMTISQRNRVIRLVSGYDGKVIRSTTLSNTPNSYQAFLDALAYSGFSLEAKQPLLTDPAGTCPAGRQFFYRTRTNGAVLNNLWSTSCSDGLAIFGGSQPVIADLFHKQFPDILNFRRGTGL